MIFERFVFSLITLFPVSINLIPRRINEWIIIVFIYYCIVCLFHFWVDFDLISIPDRSIFMFKLFVNNLILSYQHSSTSTGVLTTHPAHPLDDWVVYGYQRRTLQQDGWTAEVKRWSQGHSWSFENDSLQTLQNSTGTSRWESNQIYIYPIVVSILFVKMCTKFKFSLNSLSY